MIARKTTWKTKLWMEDNIKMNLKEVRFLAVNRDKWGLL